MSFSWTDYLSISRFLVKQGNDIQKEAAIRTAVSRAYYASYGFARNFARDNHHYIPDKGAKDHQKLHDHFSSLSSPVAPILEKLRKWRNNCDYDDQL